MNFTEQQKTTALEHARRMQVARLTAAKRIRHNSFEAWGNDKCISRTADTIRAMRNGTASDRQYGYWLAH